MTIPHLLGPIALPAEDQEFAARPARNQDSNGFWLAKACQVEKVTVGSVTVQHVAVSPGDRGARHNSDAVPDVLHQILPPPRVVSNCCHSKNLIARGAWV